MASASHQHDHSAHGAHSTRRLTMTLGLIALYFLAEVIGGFWTGSLALLADAGHMFSDMAAISISLLAARIASREPSGQRTFGFYRAEILAALINGSLLFVVAGGILLEAWHRLLAPEEVLAGPMVAIALGGLLVNLVCLGILHGGRDHNLNLKGAWLHVMGDTLGSVAVIVAAALIWGMGWIWADPVASAAVCLLILFSAWRLVSEAASILMEHAPRDVDVEQVRRSLLTAPHVQNVHCLHIWTIASGLRAVSAHIVVDDPDDPPRLAELQEMLRNDFRLEHITLQLESMESAECAGQPDGACLLTPCNRHIQ